MAGIATGVMTEGNSAASSETWAHALLLLCKLTVDLPLQEFTVADMVRLQEGVVIPAHLRVGADVAMQVNGTLLAHGEFEVAGDHLAIRLTELV
jgi:flagellar motor switch/type III secretory pathway protein FliN